MRCGAPRLGAFVANQLELRIRAQWSQCSASLEALDSSAALPHTAPPSSAAASGGGGRGANAETAWWQRAEEEAALRQLQMRLKCGAAWRHEGDAWRRALLRARGTHMCMPPLLALTG